MPSCAFGREELAGPAAVVGGVLALTLAMILAQAPTASAAPSCPLRLGPTRAQGLDRSLARRFAPDEWRGLCACLASLSAGLPPTTVRYVVDSHGEVKVATVMRSGRGPRAEAAAACLASELETRRIPGSHICGVAIVEQDFFAPGRASML